MFWRKKKPQPQTPPQPSRSSKPASNDPNAAPPKLSLLSLESRLMFDAAATATASEVNQEQVAQAQAESAVSAEGNGGEPTAAETESQNLLQAIASYSPGESTTEVAFVDPTVPDYQTLSAGMGPNVQIVMLDGGQDGMEQIAASLAGRTGIDAIHIISHGAEGQLSLGTGTLTQASMTGQYADELTIIQQALSEQADILVYGCDFAEGDVGQDAVALLSQLTGADVAASTDATGAASLGGDWILETQTGAIETHIAVTDALQMDWVGLLDISTDLLGNWTFDSNATDSSGNGNDGTLADGASINTTTSTNIVGAGKLSLDGVNDYVDLTAHLTDFTALTQGTISAWIKTTGTSGVIFSSNDIADAASGTVLWVNSSGQLEFLVYENDTALVQVRSTVAVNDGMWHQVAVTNGASGNVLYIDGVQASVTYSTGNSTTDRFFDDVTGKDTLFIGRDQRSDGSIFFEGTIDDVRVYNRVLTGGDIAQLYATSNDAPINAVPGAQSTNEDTNLVFSSGNGNQISITDPDSSGASFEVTVSVTNGSLTLAGTTGLTFTSGDGTTDTTMTFRGTVANINTALNGLTYSPTAEYNGGATLTVATLDSTLVSLDIDANLQARYTFEDTANDVAPGTAQNGTLGGDATYVTDGTRGQVLSLDGVDDYVQIAGRFGDPANVTLAAWVNLTAADSLGSHVISLGDSVLLTVDEPSVGNGVSGVYYNGSTWVKLPTGQFIAGTGWHHIAYIFDDTNNTNTLYIDGAAVATATASASISYTQGADSFIGKHGNGQTAFDFNGRIDDARVYNRALTAGEVASLAADVSLTDTDAVAITVTAVNDAPTDLSMTPVVNDIATHSITTIASQTGSQSTTATLTSGNSVGVYVSGSDVYAQIYDPQGSPLGSAVRVLGDSDLDIGPVSNPVVAALPTGGFLVVLQAQGYFNSGDWGMAIVGRAYDDGGQLINAVPGHDSTGSMIISNTSAGNTYQSNPTLDVGGDGTITVSWNNTTAGLYQQRQFHILGPTVAENAAAGTVVATLQGVDRDAGETLTYSIVGGDSNFEIVGTQLRVKAGATLDYETATSHTLTLRVTDSGGLTRDELMTIGVTDANDAPTITNLSGDSLSYSEGAGAVVIEQGGNALVADVDSSNLDTGALTVSISSGGDSAEDVLSIRNQGTGAGQIGVSGSSVTYGGVTIGTFTGGSSGSNLVITLNSNATPTAVTALVKNITYQNTDTNAPTTGARTVRYVLTDGDGGTSANYDTTVTVSAVNDAPVLTDSGLTFTVLEDAGAPVNGTAVGVLLSTFTGNITDPDGAVAKGIAIVGSTETNGTWYYTTDAGATWLAVGAVSDSASLLLADTAGTRLHFAPNSNYTGNVFPGLIVRAWDQSSGAVGTKVDTSVQGGSTAFSVQGDTIDPTVTAVNDPPVFGHLDGTPTFTEGGAAVVLDANVTFTDPELSALNGGAGDYFGSSILLERNGGPNASDVFSATGNLSPLIEGTSLVLSGVTIGHVTTNSGGTLLITFDHNATSARVNEAVQSIAYANSSEAPSSPVVINWASGDGNDGSQGTGGVLGATGSTTVTITTVNDAPVLADTALTLTVTEDAGAPSGAVGSLVSAFTGGITDVDSGAAKGIAITGTNETNGTWYYTTNGGSTWTAVGTVSNTSALLLADNASTRLYFAPSADYNGTSTGALTLRAWDQTSGTAGTKVSTASNGGTTAFSSATDTVDVTVTAVNDAPTFGVGDGQATTSFGSGWEFGKETLLQPDGKILVAGYSDSGGSDDFSLTRYNADGTLDTSFGGGDGIALAGIVGRAETAVLQPDGKIVLSGYTTDGGYQVCLVRFNADGTLDTSFGGGDGIASSGAYGSAKDVALQTDGKFLVAADLGNQDFNLMRFNSDGSLDTSFGGGSGYVSTDLAGGNDRADSLTIQSDGKVILAGFGFNGTSFDFALVRYNTDGSLDTSFNGTGKVLTDFGGNSSDTGNEVRIQTDGKIVVAGWSDTGGTNDFSITRYNANGTLDTGFGTGGQVTIDLGGSDLAEGLTIQADGKILVTGTAGINGNDFGLVRLNTDGSLDTTFSGDGIATTDYTASSDDRAYSVAVQSDGHIVVSGTSKVGALGEYNYALTRYTSTGALDTTLDPVNTLDGTPNFTEGGSPVVLDGDVQIFDAELSALDNFNGATLTLARNGGANAEDQLVFDGVVVTVSGSAVSVNGVQVGTYTFTGGEMTITLNGNATQTRVNTLMQHILYSNVSDAPPASVQINWTFNDGNSGAQGTGGALQATGSTTVTITPVNDVPTITNLSGDSLAYSEGAGAVVIEQGGNALVADIDSSNFDTGTLTISIPSGGDSAEDMLSIRNQGTGAGQIGVSGSSVTYGGVTIGTFTGGSNGTSLVITLNSSADATMVTALIKNITYENTDAAAPTTGARTVRYVLTDGDGGTSTNYDTTVTVSAVNDAPVLALGVTNLLTNGSFESGTGTGWSGNGGVEVRDNASFASFFGIPPTPDGTYFMEVEGAFPTESSYVEQTFATTAGQTYVVSLSAITRLGFNVADRGTLSIDGVEIGRFTTGASWQEQAFSFTATAASSTLRITSMGSLSGSYAQSNDGAGLVVDHVQVVAVQTAAAYTEGGVPVVLAGTARVFDAELSALNTFNGATLTLARSGGANAEDAFSGSGTLSLSGGNVVVGGTTIGTYTNSGGTLQLTLNANATNTLVNSAMQQIAYSNSSDAPPTSVQINWTFNDGNSGSQGSGGALSATSSTTVSVTAVNDAPVLADTTLSLTVAEDAGAPSGAVGSLVSAFTGGITDVDASAVKGLAITGTNETNGTWYYTTNGGTTWTAVGAVSSASSLLLADNASTRLYFAPGANYNGTSTGALTVRAWDQTSGTAGTKVSTGTNGGTTAFSSATDTVDVTVTVVNDAPTDLSLSANTVAENAANGTVVGTATGTDPDTGDTKTYSFTDNAGGRFAINSATGQITVANGSLLNYEAATSHSVTVRVTDSGGLTYDETFTINVTNVNEAPTGADATVTINEDTSHILTTANFGFSDVDAGDSLSAVRIDTIPTAGSLTLSGVAVTAGQVVTVADITAGNLVFTPAADANGIGYASFTFSVRDSGSLYDSGPNTLIFDVTAVNDATVVTGGTSGSGNEDTTLTGTLTATDAEGLSDGTVFTVSTTATNGTASIDPATGLWSYTPTADWNGSDSFTVTLTDDAGNTATQVISVTVTAVADITNDSLTTTEDTAISANVLTGMNGATADSFEGMPVLTSVTQGANGSVTFLANGTVTYTPNANFTGSDSFTYTITSGGMTETATVTVTVNAVNDSTIVTGGTSGTGNEDTTITGTLTATDVDGLSDGTVFTVTTSATNGTASIDPTTGLWSYSPTADWNGSDSFTVTITDDAGNTATQVISVTVTAVNDEPVVAVNLGSTVAEGGTDTLDASELAVTDVDNSAAQLTYTIGTGPAYGRLELTTAPGVSATTFTQADIAANRLIYVHDGSETTSDSFTFTVNDGAGGSLGVTTMSLTITPVNDTPTMTSNGGGSTAAITVAENVSAVTIVTGADVDLPVQVITYSISGGVDQARFTINSATGALNFTVPPDFEAAMDANGDNVYVVQVRVTDSQGASTTQTIQVTVTDVLESAPPPSPPAPVVPPVLVSPLPLPGEETSGPGTSRPVAPVTSVNKELIPPPVLPGSMRPPLEGAPVNVGPLLIVPSTNRPLERVPEEPKRSTADERETPLFLVNDDRGRPLFSVLPVEPVPMLEPDPPERTHFVSDLLMAKLDEMTVSLEQAVDVAQEHHELVARVAAVTGTTLSVGFVAWALRSGAILASCLATMPAWRHFDPLPVVKLTRHERSRRQEELARASQEEAMEFSGLKRVLDDKPPLKRTA